MLLLGGHSSHTHSAVAVGRGLGVRLRGAMRIRGTTRLRIVVFGTFNSRGEVPFQIKANTIVSIVNTCQIVSYTGLSFSTGHCGTQV